MKFSRSGVNQKGAPLFPAARTAHRIHRGLLTERQEHVFTWVAVVVVLLYAAAWVAAVQEVDAARHTPRPVPGVGHMEPVAPPGTPAENIAEAFFGRETPATTEFIQDHLLGFLHPLRGESRTLRFVPALPGERIVAEPPAGMIAIFGGSSGAFVAPATPGIHPLGVQLREARRNLEDLSVVTLVPREQKREGRIGSYALGTWPFERGGTPKTPRYAAPEGFIQVTPANQDFQVSEHFRLRDFLTKDQRSVWPKYLLLDPLLVDKLELTVQELERQGVDVRAVHVMSGFRTPRYNTSGGNTQGRANLSRHMYGDGADVYVDNDRDGSPDDITGDGRVTVADAEKMARAAEIVEQKHSRLVGGIGIYVACCGHGPFTHIDVRGYRARWRGTGNG